MMTRVLFIIESTPKLGLYQKQLCREVIEPITSYFSDNYNHIYYGCIMLTGAIEPWPSNVEIYTGSSNTELHNKIQDYRFYGMGKKFQIEPCIKFWADNGFRDGSGNVNVNVNGGNSHLSSSTHHKFSILITSGRMEIPIDFFEYNEKNGIALSLISLSKNDLNMSMHEKYFPKFTNTIPISSSNIHMDSSLLSSLSSIPSSLSNFHMRIVGLKTVSINPSIIKQLETSVRQFISTLITMNIGQRQSAIKSQLESPALSVEYKTILRAALSKLQGTPLVDAIWEGIFKFRQDGSEVSFQASLVLISPDNSPFSSACSISSVSSSVAIPPGSSVSSSASSSFSFSNSDLTEFKCDYWPKTLITHSYFSINSTMAQRCLQEGPNVFLTPIGKNSEYADILKHSLQNKSLCALVHLDSNIKMIVFSSRSIPSKYPLNNGSGNGNGNGIGGGNSLSPSASIHITSNLLGIILNKNILTSQVNNSNNVSNVSSSNSSNNIPIVNGNNNGNNSINNNNNNNNNEPNVILSKHRNSKSEDDISNPIPEAIDHLKNRQIYMELSKERQFDDYC